MNPELKRTLSIRFPSLGTSEYLLAYKLATEKTEPAIAEEIEQHRAQFLPSHGTVAAGILLPADKWREVYEQAEKAAKRELLKDSNELSELERLEKAAEEARKLADAKNAELSRLWQEFQAIPEQIDAANARQEQTANELQALDADRLAEEFKSHYRAVLDGAIAQASWMDAVAVRMVTASLRKEVLTQLDVELSGKINELKARQKTLAKKFGQTV
jgi:DNA repair exonuclease SbcCD ATPase subunit